jgi:hypothetical protein
MPGREAVTRRGRPDLMKVRNKVSKRGGATSVTPFAMCGQGRAAGRPESHRIGAMQTIDTACDMWYTLVTNKSRIEQGYGTIASHNIASVLATHQRGPWARPLPRRGAMSHTNSFARMLLVNCRHRMWRHYLNRVHHHALCWWAGLEWRWRDFRQKRMRFPMPRGSTPPEPALLPFQLVDKLPVLCYSPLRHRFHSSGARFPRRKTANQRWRACRGASRAASLLELRQGILWNVVGIRACWRQRLLWCCSTH